MARSSYSKNFVYSLSSKLNLVASILTTTTLQFLCIFSTIFTGILVDVYNTFTFFSTIYRFLILWTKQVTLLSPSCYLLCPASPGKWYCAWFNNYSIRKSSSCICTVASEKKAASRRQANKHTCPHSLQVHFAITQTLQGYQTELLFSKLNNLFLDTLIHKMFF